MAEYIEREALLKWFEPYLGVGETWVEIHPVLDAIYALSNANVVPVVHGDWYGCGNMWMCTVCDDLSYTMTNYCPNCGARMDGE